MESRRKKNIMGYDPLGWGGDTHGIRKKKIYHGIRPFRVGGGTLMESGRRNFIMGYDPLGWGGTLMESGRRNFIMGYDPLGWGGHSWNQEEEILSWDTTL